MGRIAFIFSGQGDQYPGMGKEICEKYSEAANIFELCDAIRNGTSQQCFSGTQQELSETKNTQPCMYALELAATQVLYEHGIRPDAVAGFSLGEVAAATVAGLFDVKTGFSLVCKRGELMQRDAEKVEASMAAVLKLSENELRDICDKFEGVYPVNFNCPGQITISGKSEHMPEVFALIKQSGGRAIPLKVKGGFHSPFMREASREFALELENVKIGDMEIALYSNLTSQIYGNNIIETLAKQICSPVYWEKTVRNMIDSGIDTFIEIGPGRTLTNMMAKIDSNVKAYCISDLDTVISEVGNA